MTKKKGMFYDATPVLLNSQQEYAEKTARKFLESEVAMHEIRIAALEELLRGAQSKVSRGSSETVVKIVRGLKENGKTVHPSTDHAEEPRRKFNLMS